MVRKGYKITEVGEIPEDWEVVLIGDIASEIGDGIHSTPTYSSKGDYYFVNGNNLTNGEITITQDTKKAESSEFKKHKKNLSDRSILLSINGTIGNLALYKEEPIILGKSAAYLNIRKEFSRQYIYFGLQTKSVEKHFENGLTGTTIRNLGLGTIRNAPIAIPPLPEQKAIARALSDVDALIAALDKLINKKRHIKTATMQQLLTGKKRLPGFGEGKGYKNTDVGLIPEDWEVVQLGSLGKFKNGINKNSKDFGYGSPFVNLMDVFGVSSISAIEHLDLVNSNDSEKSAYSLKEGDVLFVRSSVKPSGVGLTTVVAKDLPNTVYSGFLIRFRDNGSLDTNFKKYCFWEEKFRQSVIANSTVSANTNINQDNLKKLNVAYPQSLKEQKAIATILTDIDGEIAALEKRRAKTQAIKKGMMQELLTGKTRLI